MSDMRQKLLPVFLEEAGRKIEQLDSFFTAVGGEGCSLEDLESAFRAAHTLKGTAALVKADAVRELSGRIEGILEGHFEKSRFPSDVEYEAMQLALERLKLLIDAVANNSVEPAALLIEAELALKLATAMPGRRPLTALLSPTCTDPFADDPELDIGDQYPEDKLILAEPEDPFVDAQGVKFKAGASVLVADPFAEDPELDLELMPPAVTPEKQPSPFSEPNDSFATGSLVNEIQADPFANDPDFLPETLPNQGQADQTAGSFIERMRKRIEKESALQTAERLSEMLSRQDEGELVASNYSCCRFCVAEKDYYLPIANMLEIADIPKVLRLPLAPSVVKGLINLRGHVIPVIDLSLLAGTTPQYVALRKLVIAEANGEKLAFLSDGIPGLYEEIQGEKVDVTNFIEQFRAGGA